MLPALLVAALAPSEVPPTPPAVPEGAPPPAWSEPLAFGDLTGDELDDLVVADAAGDRVLRGRADGGFDEVTAGSGLAGGSREVLLRDLDGDGHLDLLRVSAAGAVGLAAGLGDAHFGPEVELAPPEGLAGPLGPAVRVVLAGATTAEAPPAAPADAPDLLVRHAHGEAVWALGADGPSLRLVRTPDGEADGRSRSDALPPAAKAETVARGLDDLASLFCLQASSVPFAGALVPLSAQLNVDALGRVGIGTTSPAARLDVAGNADLENGAVHVRSGGVAVARAERSTATGGGEVALFDAGTETVRLRAVEPGLPSGSLVLSDPGSGDSARVHTRLGPTLDPFAELELRSAGQLRARVSGDHVPVGPLARQVLLYTATALPTAALAAGAGTGSGLVELRDATGQDRVELEAEGDGRLTLTDDDFQSTVLLRSSGSVEAAEAELATAEGVPTVRLLDDFEDTGAGRVELGLEGVGSTVFLDGGSTGVGPELFLNQQDGSRAVTLRADPTEAGNGGSLVLSGQSGAETLGFARSLFGAGPHGLFWIDDPTTEAARAIELGVPSTQGTPGFAAYNSAGNVLVDLFTTSSAGAITLRSGNGVRECILGSTAINLFDGTGTPNLSWSSTTGQKNAVVPTESHGPRLLYVREGTGAWFEEAGTAETRGGSARVELDPAFLALVTVDARDPLRVFVSPHADRVLHASADGTGFDVRTASGADARFSWVVQATRAGFEGVRLEPPDSPR